MAGSGSTSEKAFRKLGTEPRILDDLSFESRRRFIERYGHPDGVPILSVASSRMSIRSSAFLFAALQKAVLGIVSDGVVPTESQSVPGAYQVKLEDMDHFESVVPMPGLGNYKPGALTEALVGTLLSLPEAGAP